MIELYNVARDYGTEGAPVHALWDTDLTIDEGEFVAVMGPSGSGKSTLLSVIGGMNPPSSGRLLIDGIDVYGLGVEQQADFRHEYVGFLFQQLQLLPYLTALENVLLGLAIARMPRRAKTRRARQVLGQVGLDDKEARLPLELSGGEQGRVAIARAIVNRPPLILADEPTGNLDRATGALILDLLQGLNERGHTVLMVTHDADAVRYAGRVIHILDGRVNGDHGASPSH